MPDNKYDTIIVGGGIAGLTSAAYLANHGRKVLLIEKNKECGGLVNSFSRDGFQFDAGVRALENAGIIFPMLEQLGIELEVIKSDVSVGIGKDILHVEGIESVMDYRDLLLKHFPESKQDIDALIKVIQRIMKHMDVLYGVENPMFKDMIHDRRYLFGKLLPWLPKFALTIGKINRMNMPVEMYLETIVKDASLRDMISQHFFKCTPSFFALSYFSLYLDYFYPKGGVGKLSGALEDKITECGGKIKKETSITNIYPSKNQVKDDKDKIYTYDALVWAADLKTFYKITSTDYLSDKIKQRFEYSKSKMLEKRGGDSVFTLFIEVDEPLDSFRKIAHGHFFYSPLKQGLGDTHRKELDALLKRWDTIKKKELMNWLERFIKLNTFEISIPGLKDPDLVPKGKTGLTISILAEYDLFKKAQDSGWHDEFILELERLIVSSLSNSIYPMLKDKIITQFSFSPLSIQNRVGSSEGAITGWSFQESVPVINKIQASNKAIVTPIPNIFQAGQWTYSPAGVPMSILTGKLAADNAMKKYRIQT